MLRATDFAHAVLRRVVGPGDWVVDATVGNGHDTELLAELVGAQGRVFGFDVQAAAIAVAGRRLEGRAQVTLFHAGHELTAAFLPAEARGRLAAVVFNLGYLPGGDKAVVTGAETTLSAIKQALVWLRVGGVAAVVLYPGHAAGAGETEAVLAFARALPTEFVVTHMARLNASAATPEVVVMERRS